MSTRDRFVLNNRVYWLSLAVLLVSLFAYQWLSGATAGLDPASPWSGDRVGELPVWLRVWLVGIVLPVFLLSIFFIWKRAAPRWVLGGFILSHVPIFVDLMNLTVGMVGWIHLICWSPGLVFLVRERASHSVVSPYGLWTNVATTVIFISLVFDAISALRYVLV